MPPTEFTNERLAAAARSLGFRISASRLATRPRLEGIQARLNITLRQSIKPHIVSILSFFFPVVLQSAVQPRHEGARSGPCAPAARNGMQCCRLWALGWRMSVVKFYPHLKRSFLRPTVRGKPRLTVFVFSQSTRNSSRTKRP